MDARLRFLEQASEALAVTSPTVSSLIRATKREAASLQGLETAAPENTCSACSQSLILSWSCEPIRTIEHRQTRQQRISGNASTTKCVKCSACGTENTIQHQKRKRTNEPKLSITTRDAKRKITISVEQPTPVSLPEPTPVPSPTLSKEQTPEAVSTKPTARRKARGKNATLQALLANKKPEAPKSSGFGLDFMDFMK